MSADTDSPANGQGPTALRQCADALGQLDVVVKVAVHTSITRCPWAELIWETEGTDEGVDPDVRRVIGEHDCRVTETVACDGYAMASVQLASGTGSTSDADMGITADADDDLGLGFTPDDSEAPADVADDPEEKPRSGGDST